jgi:hypothetical protein
MNLRSPVVPRDAEGVLRVYCPTPRTSTTRETAGSEIAPQNCMAVLGRIYTGPILHCHYLGQTNGSLREMMARLVSARCDLILVEDLGRLSRNPCHLMQFAENCVDSRSRLIAWNDEFDTATDDWFASLALRTLRMETFRAIRRRRARPRT